MFIQGLALLRCFRWGWQFGIPKYWAKLWVMGHPRLWRKAQYGENAVSNKVQSVTVLIINYRHQEQNTENVAEFCHHIDSPLFFDCPHKRTFGPWSLILPLAKNWKMIYWYDDLPTPFSVQRRLPFHLVHDLRLHAANFSHQDLGWGGTWLFSWHANALHILKCRNHMRCLLETYIAIQYNAA